MTKKIQAIKAENVLDTPLNEWNPRSWESRREYIEQNTPFCDLIASKALALIATKGFKGPKTELFLKNNTLDAWRGEFEWGNVWCVSNQKYIFVWAQGEGTSDARIEISGPRSQWDDDLTETFAESLMI